MSKKQPPVSKFDLLIVICLIASAVMFWAAWSQKEPPEDIRLPKPVTLTQDIFDNPGSPLYRKLPDRPDPPAIITAEDVRRITPDTPELQDKTPQAPVEKDEQTLAPIEEPEKPAPVIKQTYYKKTGRKPRIMIIIDDMGIDRTRSATAIKLPGPLTMAFLPHAVNIANQTEAAHKAGHALMVHMPMEPMSGEMMNTPGMLHEGLDQGQLAAQMEENLGRFSGYLGINNHMGSRLTQNRQAMDTVMSVLNERGLYFIDSRTIAGSVAAERARAHNVPVLVRDVFLDHKANIDYVRKALRNVERIAAKDGLAIAIGHPKDATIQGLAEWLPTVKDKGYILVSAEDVIQELYPDSVAASRIDNSQHASFNDPVETRPTEDRTRALLNAD